MKLYTILFGCVLGLCLTFTEQGNILGLFPHYGFSHYQVFYPLMKGLADRGHNVTVVSYFKNRRDQENYHEIILQDGVNGIDLVSLENHTSSRTLWSMFKEFMALHDEGQRSCKAFYETPYVMEILRRHTSIRYDMVILEIFNTDCYYGLAYALQVPIVALSSCALMPWHYKRFAIPDTPSYIQSEFIGFNEELTMIERLTNFIQSHGNKILYWLTEKKDSYLIRKYLEFRVDVQELVKRTSLVFVNQHYSLSGNRPLPSQVKEIGGIHIPPESQFHPIPQEIETFLSESHDPVLFISFGSMIQSSTMPKHIFRTIIAALNQIRVRVIWRWDGDVPFHSTKYLFTKWTPQLSILCHPKVDVFWGHGGLLGTTEAVYCGIPMIVTPFYGDQFLNSKAVENRKIGIILNYGEISQNKIFNVMRDVLRPFYKIRALSVSKVFRNRENTPLETAIWWIEHIMYDRIAEHLLRTKAVDLNWFFYYSLDSICLLIFMAGFPAFAIYYFF